MTSNKGGQVRSLGRSEASAFDTESRLRLWDLRQCSESLRLQTTASSPAGLAARLQVLTTRVSQQRRGIYSSIPNAPFRGRLVRSPQRSSPMNVLHIRVQSLGSNRDGFRPSNRCVRPGEPFDQLHRRFADAGIGHRESRLQRTIEYKMMSLMPTF